jgi:hypothetical protein
MLLSTADLDCSRSGSFRTDFGARLRFVLLLAVGTASNCRGKDHDPRHFDPSHPPAFIVSHRRSWDRSPLSLLEDRHLSPQPTFDSFFAQLLQRITR